MKNLMLFALTAGLLLFTASSFSQLKRIKQTIVVKGGTPPYNPIPPIFPTFVDFKKITISPRPADASKSILDIVSKGVYPKGFPATINGTEYAFYDNGKYPDKVAKDGIYSSIIREKSRTKEPVNVDIDPKGNAVSTGRWSIKPVKCPKGCKSLIFGTECRVCFVFSAGSD